jgi:hypothetical protein
MKSEKPYKIVTKSVSNDSTKIILRWGIETTSIKIKNGVKVIIVGDQQIHYK